MAFKVPNFRSAIMGFHKVDVTDYLARTESEMEILESRQAAADKTIDSMKSEIQNLTRRLEILTEENCSLETANAQLRQQAFAYDEGKVTLEVHEKALAQIQELQEKLLEAQKQAQSEGEARKRLEAENAGLKRSAADNTPKMEGVEMLQKECDDLRANVIALEGERKTVQDALISAQRMGEIILGEARSQADQMVCQAKDEAQDLLTKAQRRNEELQACYDRMLMDTGKMKSELIELYRRHLALLAEIPGKGEVPVLESEVLESVDA